MSYFCCACFMLHLFFFNVVYYFRYCPELEDGDTMESLYLGGRWQTCREWPFLRIAGILKEMPNRIRFRYLRHRIFRKKYRIWRQQQQKSEEGQEDSSSRNHRRTYSFTPSLSRQQRSSRSRDFSSIPATPQRQLSFSSSDASRGSKTPFRTPPPPVSESRPGERKYLSDLTWLELALIFYKQHNPEKLVVSREWNPIIILPGMQCIPSERRMDWIIPSPISRFLFIIILFLSLIGDVFSLCFPSSFRMFHISVISTKGRNHSCSR